MVTQKMYNLSIDLLLTPIINRRNPTAHIKFNNTQTSIELAEPTWYSFTASGSKETVVKLEIEHYGKTNADTDPATGDDLAIIVDQIKINGIVSPKFVWEGVYYPNYPDHLQDQPKELKYSSYLGWNGTWILTVTLPAFTWIHRVENLGWIYD